ncbi:hypothetical protein ASD97_26055 [Streptomyces sp. Root63]|nr:hypothetical protein ASD29_32360 [Streptomyces sp. Root1295]KRA34098.1 hypothetical protein ASD97_26055 [Streptomyces sp. Root63]
MSKEGKFHMTFEQGWERKMLSTLEAGALVAESTEKVRMNMVSGAPRSRTTKTNWNQIKKNISGFVEKDVRGHYGNVTIELNERVRHTLLQDRGWTDKGGRRHPGKRFAKEALLKARIE